MDNPPSVLFVLPWALSPVNGVDLAVLNLARSAAAHRGLRPLMFCVDPTQETCSTTEYDDIRMISGRLHAPQSQPLAAGGTVDFLRSVRGELAEWRALIRQHNVRVIDAHFPGLHYFTLALLRRRTRGRVRLIFSLHGDDLRAIQGAGRIARAGARWVLRQGDAVVCCSDDLARVAQQTLRLDERRLHTIYQGVDIEELERSRGCRYRPPTGAFTDYLVCVAAFDQKKGQDLLLEAFTQLVRQGLKAALVLIGRRTPFLTRVRGLVRRLGLQDHVFFVHDLDHQDTLAAIRQARVLVQPSREEAFGLSLLEAGYLETPIVATAVGAIPEVLGTYYPYLARPDDAEALAETIHEVLYNPTEARRQVELIRRHVATRFTWGIAYDRYDGVWLSGS